MIDVNTCIRIMKDDETIEDLSLKRLQKANPHDFKTFPVTIFLYYTHTRAFVM